MSNVVDFKKYRDSVGRNISVYFNHRTEKYSMQDYNYRSLLTNEWILLFKGYLSYKIIEELESGMDINAFLERNNE